MPDSTRNLVLKRRRKAGSLDDVRLIQWRAIDAAQETLYKMARYGNLGGVLSAVHAITQAGSAYARIVETTELMVRIEALEAADRQSGSRNGRLRRVS